MSNFSAFSGYFLSYLILFCIMVALAVGGSLAGIRWRKTKNAKEAAEDNGTPEKDA